MTESDRQGPMDGFDERASRRSADLEEFIESFERRLKEATDAARAEFEPLAERFRSNWHELRARLEEMSTATGEARESLARDVERGLSQLEAEVGAARGGLEAELAETRESYRKAFRQQLDAWRAGLEHLQVQAALAEKEARSELSELVDRAENAYRAARQHLARVEADSAETLDVLRAGARRVVEDLKEAVEAGWNRLRWCS